MTDKSVNIIWRDNSFYPDINSLINNVVFTGQFNIYNLSDNDIEANVEDKSKIGNIVRIDMEEEKTYVNNVVKTILEDDENKDKRVTIIDSCILYNDIIDLDLNNDDCSIFYIQINKTKNSLFLPVSFKITDINLNNLDIIPEKTIDSDKILLDGSLDEQFLVNYYDINLNSSRGVKLLLLEFILDQYVIDISRNIPKNTIEIHYIGIIKYLKHNDIKFLINSFKVSTITFDALYYLIEASNEQNKSIIQDTILKNINKTPIRSLFRIRNLNKDKIYDYVIQTLIDKQGSKFKIENIPKWIDTTFIDYIYKYYPSLINNTKQISGEIFITKNIKYIDKNIYSVNNKNLVINSKTIEYENSTITEKCHTFLYFKDKHILLLNSINPIKLNIIKDNNLVNIFTYEDIIDEKYNILGPIIPFFNRFVTLLKYRENLYRIAVFEKTNIKLQGLSKIFKIEEGIPISLCVNDNNMQILLEKEEKLYMADIDHVKLFTEISNTIDIDDIFTLEIKDRNNIKLLLEGYENISDKYEGFVFNREDEEILCTVKYNPKSRIFDMDKKQIYYKDFIYLPKNIVKKEKTADLCFHSDSQANKLKEKCKELGLTFTDNYSEAKYFIIEHKYFEKLNSLELSDIIENNCLIISLIENSDINSPNFKKTYTSNSSITKLFLFNIAKNESYIQFIFDKIIHDNQYEARKQYFEIDKNKIFNETNIYKTILSLRDENKSNNIIKLCDKGIEIWNNIKAMEEYKPFRFDKNIEYLFKYIIDNNFKLDIAYQLDEENSLVKLLSKVNFMGECIQFSNNYENASIFDIIVSESDDILENIDNFSSPALIFNCQNNTLIQI